LIEVDRLGEKNIMRYSIPTNLETERLRLRIFRESDWKDIHEYYGDPECAKYTSRQPLKDYETWQKLAALVGHWELRNYGSYAIEEKISGRVVGVAGLDYPVDWPEPEIQWGLSRKYWGNGYASEAVRAVKKTSAESLPDLSLISLIHPENSNSINLAKAVGAHFEKEHLFRDETWLIFRH
jgi:RimJ/RimL family protein N-acetyltransferase